MRWISGTWRRAQEREAVAWRRLGLARESYLARRGEFLDAWLRFWGAAGDHVLEIGGAGLPCVEYLHGFARREAVDPLMDQYQRLFHARGRAGRAEELPFPRHHFDAVVMLNVLDHVDEPARALAEIRRVLRPGGMLFLSCDTYSAPWLALRAVRIALRGMRNNDFLHPHHFTVKSLVRLVRRHFEPLEICNRHCDPLIREAPPPEPYPLGGARNRLKRAGRVYVAAR